MRRMGPICKYGEQAVDPHRTHARDGYAWEKLGLAFGHVAL